MDNKNMDRRDFLKASSIVGVGSVVGASALLAACSGGEKLTPLRQPGEYYVPELPDKAIDGKEIKVGLVGCGGRGRGAVQDTLAAANNIKVVALGDVFPEKVESVRNHLKANYQQDVPAENCFVGFDAYKKVIDAGIDMVILTTPPNFRPEHFQYAVQKGKHSFMEKPIAVDPKGYRTIMAAAKQAKAKNLSAITGIQRRHQRCYVEAFKLIQEGIIGEITGGNVYWNQNMLWYRNREQGWSDMEWMIRDWVNWKWLSGDHIVEQHVHNIDVFLWMSGLKIAKATAFGSRQRRLTGDQYDNFSVDFEMENGVHLHSMCRQIDGCSNKVGEFIQGTKGSWNSRTNEIKDLNGNVIWKYDQAAAEAQFKQHNPYTLEHVDLINHIRKGEGYEEASDCAVSCLAAIMARESAYKGSTITWDEISKSDLDYMPEKLELGPVDMTAPQYQVAVPGKEQK
jgi:predicted dehydrogenase